MHLENLWFLWSKPSNYQEKLSCHAARDGRTDGGGKWKVVQYSGRPETAIKKHQTFTLWWLWIFFEHFFPQKFAKYTFVSVQYVGR